MDPGADEAKGISLRIKGQPASGHPGLIIGKDVAETFYISEAVTMDDLMKELAKWKGRALEAAQRACENCEEYREGMVKCKDCRMKQILEEAAK